MALARRLVHWGFDLVGLVVIGWLIFRPGEYSERVKLQTRIGDQVFQEFEISRDSPLVHFTCSNGPAWSGANRFFSVAMYPPVLVVRTQWFHRPVRLGGVVRGHIYSTPHYESQSALIAGCPFRSDREVWTEEWGEVRKLEKFELLVEERGRVRRVAVSSNVWLTVKRGDLFEGQ
jgi:hypothetical protein